jgi:predicted alpha/beta hydrolase family esterase
MPNPIVLIHPGLNNSGPQHWQTRWEQEHGFTRIQQQEWDTPVCEDWITTLDHTITQYRFEQVIIVAHSLACCTVAHWAHRFNRVIKGALLVGPSDVEAPSYPPGTTGFQPMPLNKLPFPTVTVASTDDEYVTIERAQQFADAWGSRLVNIGNHGHINSLSNLGSWPEGFALLQQLY